MKNHCSFPFPLVVLAALLCAPVSGFAQASTSILLSAGDFAILGGTAVTSTGTVGTVIVNGNVGSAVAITGFPPAVVTPPSTTVVAGAVVNQALLDVGTAQVGLAGMPSNVNMSNVDLGGTTLLPGVYTFDNAATLNGALTLDANGQNGAFWVFQIGTTLTTSIGASVIVIDYGTNGGSDDGIFWNAGSGITIGANNQVLGNYLAGTSITFSGTTSGSGGARALAQAGVSLDQNPVNPLGGPGGGDWTGGLKYGPGGTVVPIPEPAAFLWLAPLGVMGFAIWRRRAAVKSAVA